MSRLLSLTLAAGYLALAPRLVAAQAGGFPVRTTSRTQFVFINGEVVQREDDQTTALTQNVKLANGTKINYKNGIVEMPADKIYPQGKKLTLREDDYVRADGGVVFATPASAAAARGGPPRAPEARYDTYVQRGPGYPAPASASTSAQQVPLLTKKIGLLTQKINLLSQGRADLPDTRAIDNQLTQVEAELTAPK